MKQKHTKYTQINLCTVKWASETKPTSENCKNCSSKCGYDCAQLQATIQHRTEERECKAAQPIRQTPRHNLMKSSVDDDCQFELDSHG